MNPKVTEKLEKIKKKSEKPYLFDYWSRGGIIKSSKYGNVGWRKAGINSETDPRVNS